VVPLDLRQVGACEGQQVVVEIGADDFDSSMMQFDWLACPAASMRTKRAWYSSRWTVARQ